MASPQTVLSSKQLYQEELGEDGLPTWYHWNKAQYKYFWDHILSLGDTDAYSKPHNKLDPHYTQKYRLAAKLADKWFSCMSFAYCDLPWNAKGDTKKARDYAKECGLEGVMEKLEEYVYLRKYNDLVRIRVRLLQGVTV